MGFAKGVIAFIGTAFIAAVVAYSVSAPRNFESSMNEEMPSLGGKSINQAVKEAKAEAKREQCETFTELASEAWDRAVENDSLDRDASKIEKLDRQADRYCD
ncbi:MAG: hypothetical protein ABJ242_06195 [Marinomonas sp.]|uniref:hypothetical protein n=1 Tax=Parasphingorhabdus sp. TaxID=2709688 RepID=UPI003295D5FC